MDSTHTQSEEPLPWYLASFHFVMISMHTMLMFTRVINVHVYTCSYQFLQYVYPPHSIYFTLKQLILINAYKLKVLALLEKL